MLLYIQKHTHTPGIGLIKANREMFLYHIQIWNFQCIIWSKVLDVFIVWNLCTENAKVKLPSIENYTKNYQKISTPYDDMNRRNMRNFTSSKDN